MAVRLLVRCLLGVLATAGISHGGLSADAPAAQVTVPLVVTDASGRSVRELAPGDIDVTAAGSRQTVSSLSFRGDRPARIAIYLDEFHVSPGDAAVRVRDALSRFIDRHVRPGDSLVVMKPLDPPASIRALVDAGVARRRAAAFEGRRGDYAPRGAFESAYLSRSPGTADRQRAQVVRAGLESLAQAMGETPDAPGALILVSEGFSGNEPSRMRVTTLRTVGRAARLANLPVYVLDPTAGARAGSDHGLTPPGQPRVGSDHGLTPSLPRPAQLDGAWQAIAEETGGRLFSGGADLDAALTAIAHDIRSQHLLAFPLPADDGRFHELSVRVKRRGAAVRAPSGFWAPFPASRLPAVRRSRPYANLRTPHTSGLIQSWFRMAPAGDGRTRVTFAWVPRGGPRVPPDTVAFTATTFEGDEVHAARVGPLAPTTPDGPRELTFTAAPGPLQITMAIGAGRPLDSDVRYLEVPALDATRPSIVAVEFVRPRSLPEFNALLKEPAVMPTETRAFHRQDRLLVRVRAFAAAGPPDVRVVLRNRQGTPLLELTRLPRAGDAAQFELPFARYPRGDYRLEVEARSGSERVSTIVTLSLLG